MTFTGNNLQIPIVIACVNKAVRVVNPAAKSLPLRESLRLADTIHKTISLNIFNESVDTLQSFFIFGLPGRILAKSGCSKTELVH
jgi:hypothetical protein